MAKVEKRGGAGFPLTIEEMQAIAAERGGRCLSTQYVNAHTKLEWECAVGHRWYAVPSSVKPGTWCRQCSIARKIRYTIEQMRALAQESGGRCLSETFITVHYHLRWQCAEGHEWEATGQNILAGKWCPRCKGSKIRAMKQFADGLARLQAAAQKHGGRCLSTSYENVKTRYRFECSQGHQWEDTGEAILDRGQWCRACGFTRLRYTLEDARRVARERGGECLSTVYVNSSTKMEWLCHRGHAWWAKFAAIVQGHWCRECANMAKISNAKSKARLRYLAVGTLTNA